MLNVTSVRPVSFVIPLIVVAACASSNGARSSHGAGGSGTSTENLLGSCDTRAVAGPSAGQCRDWVGDSSADLSVSCDGLDGAFSATEACPDEGRVASCSVGPALGATAIYNYYSPDYTPASAETNCNELGGIFEAAADAGGGGTGGTTGTGGTSGATGGTGSGCTPECLRAYECAASCNDTPVNYGCCPCPEGMIDVITCPK